MPGLFDREISASFLNALSKRQPNGEWELVTSSAFLIYDNYLIFPIVSIYNAEYTFKRLIFR